MRTKSNWIVWLVIILVTLYVIDMLYRFAKAPSGSTFLGAFLPLIIVLTVALASVERTAKYIEAHAVLFRGLGFAMAVLAVAGFFVPLKWPLLLPTSIPDSVPIMFSVFLFGLLMATLPKVIKEGREKTNSSASDKSRLDRRERELL